MSAPHLIAGRDAEERALRYLKAQGLVPMLRNFRCRYGELDLVLSEGETVVVVEVRYRRSAAFASAAESVDWHKQRKILRATGHLLQRRPALRDRPLRFDVVAITGRGENPHIDWLIDAFAAD